MIARTTLSMRNPQKSLICPTVCPVLAFGRTTEKKKEKKKRKKKEKHMKNKRKNIKQFAKGKNELTRKMFFPTFAMFSASHATSLTISWVVVVVEKVLDENIDDFHEFLKHVSFSKRNQQPNCVSPFFKGKVTLLLTNQKTHILRVNMANSLLFVDTGLGVLFVVLCCCRDPGNCLLPVLVWSLPLLLSKKFWSGMVSDGFQTQRRGSWIPGKELAESVLASAVSIDGRMEWDV